MMNRFIPILAAACLSVSAGLLVQNTLAADDPTVTHSSSSVTYSPPADNSTPLPTGITPKSLNSDKAIEKSFQKLANDALSKNGFDNVVALLADQDSDRIKKSTGNSLTNLDGNKNKALNDLVDNLGNAWRTKYNQKFDMDYTKVFTPDFIRISTGEVSDPNLLIDNWPIDASFMAANAGAGKVSVTDAQTAQKKAFGGRVNLEKGRNVAVAQLLSVHAVPGINASLIHETLSGWKFDIPNTIDAQKLYDNLVANLGYLNSHQDQWPADVNDGYREVTHAVVAAIYDINLTTNTALDNSALRPSNTNTVNNR